MTTIESNGHDSHELSDSAGNAPLSNDAGALALLVWLSGLARGGPDSAESDTDLDEALQTSRAVGPFRLEALLGQGAYGAVFRAFDIELERHVALKIAWPHVMFDKTSSRRFIEEPKTAAALDHRGIVRIYKSGMVDAVAYIAFELVDGPTLGEWLKQQGHVPFDLAAKIVADVADAIGHAHENGVIHRDLKPSNILLKSRGGGEHFRYDPMVVDFGLAHRASSTAVSSITATRDIVGTDPYIAPEQFEGGTRRADATTDVFSLGVILYELIAGRRPFNGETAEETRNLIRNEDPPSIGSLRRSVPRDLETISAKCLEKSPARRYASATELAADLRRFLNNEPIKARATARWERAWKYTQKRPKTVLLAGAAILCAFIVSGVIGAWLNDRRTSAQQIAAAEAATNIAEGIERQHRYAANIQHAAESLRRNVRRDTIELLQQCRSLAQEPVHCGIEWDLLAAQANDSDRTLEAHPGGVYYLRFSQNAKQLVSAGKDGRVIVWDTKTWTSLAEFNDRVGEANVAVMSPDGSLLALAGDDGRVVIHRMTDRSTLFDEQIVTGKVSDLAWLGDSSRFAVGGEDAILSIINPDTRERRETAPLPTPDRHRIGQEAFHASIKALTYLPDLNQIAVAATTSEVRILDLSDLSVVRSWEVNATGVSAICYVGAGPGYLVTCDGNRTMRVWNAKDGSKVAEYPLDHVVTSLRLSADQKSLAAGYRDGTVGTWDIDQVLTGHGVARRTALAHTGRTTALDYSSDAAWLASGGQDGQIRIWPAGAMSNSFDVPLKRRPWVTRFSPCGRWLAVVEAAANDVSQLTVFDVHRGQALWSSPSQVSPVAFVGGFYYTLWPLGFDPSGEEIVFTQLGDVVCGHDSRTGKAIKTYKVPGIGGVTRLQMLTDGESLLAKRRNDDAFIMDRATCAISEHFVDRGNHTIGVFRTLNGNQWLDADESRTFSLRPKRAATPTHVLKGPTEPVTTVTVSRDGRSIAMSGNDRVIYAWDLVRPMPPKKFVGHEDTVVNLCYSADGRTILSHSADGTVRLWHVATGSELLKLGTPEELITCMDLNPDGNLLVLGVENHGEWGLKLYRLGADRRALPRSFQGLPQDEP